MANELKGTLFDCLMEKEKTRCKRKGVRMAKIDNLIFKIKGLLKRGATDGE